MVYNQSTQVLIHGLSNFPKKSGKHSDVAHEIINDCDAFVRKKKGQMCSSHKLKPLNTPMGYEEHNKKGAATKPLKKINSQNIVPSVSTSNRRLPSKIPVLQYPKTEKINYAIWDTSLSAADRRQKFHQSRLYVAPPCFDVKSKLNHIYYKDAELKYHSNIPQENKLCASSCGKVILPPIKNCGPEMNGKENTPQTRKKCLRGEITHFPALCLSSKPVKKCIISSVPHLPPIFSSPVAPPPSVSTSLENDSNKVK